MQIFVNLLRIIYQLVSSYKNKIVQSGGFVGRFLGPLLKTGLTSMKNVIKPSAKSVLIPLGLTAAAAAAAAAVAVAADAGIHKKS